MHTCISVGYLVGFIYIYIYIYIYILTLPNNLPLKKPHPTQNELNLTDSVSAHHTINDAVKFIKPKPGSL